MQDGVFKPVVVQDRHVDVRLPHDCSTAGVRPLCCIDENGIHTCGIIFQYIHRPQADLSLK